MGFLDVLLGWVLLFHPALSILLIALIVSLIITLAIKFLTDQSLMKDLRNELKELQTEMKDLKNNPKKMAKVNDRFMETNMKYMSQSMRPTLFTFLPIILVFGWLGSHIGYLPLVPDEPFKLTVIFEDGIEGDIELQMPDEIHLLEGDTVKSILHKEVDWLLSGPAGEYDLLINFEGKEYNKKVIITTGREYAPVETSFKKKILFFSSKDEYGVNMIKLSNEKIIPFSTVPIVKDIPWVGTWGWFGTYFVFSLIFSMSLRRLFKIH